MVHAVMIPKFSVTIEDIKNAHTIFGTYVPSLKVKMARRQPKTLVYNYVKITKDILQIHQMVLVAAEVMLINGILGIYVEDYYMDRKFENIRGMIPEK